MGKQRDFRVYNLICRNNRKRLRYWIGKHSELKTSHTAMLIFGAIWHNHGLLRWLLERGVSPDCRMGACGNTPLMQAAADGDLVTMQLLLEFGANPNAVTDESENPLGFAVAWKEEDAIRLLVQSGANINDTIDSGPGRTQLDWVELGEWKEGIEVLRILGAKRYDELAEL